MVSSEFKRIQQRRPWLANGTTVCKTLCHASEKVTMFLKPWYSHRMLGWRHMSFRTCFGSQGSSVWPNPLPPFWRKEWLKGRFLLLEISCHGKTSEKSSCHGGIWFQVNSKEYNKGDSGWQMAPLSAKPCVMRRKKWLCFWSLWYML